MWLTRAAWMRFWALPWRLKAPALALISLAPSALIVVVVILATGDAGESAAPPATATPAPTSVPSATPTKTPTATSTAIVPPGADPAEFGYRLTRTIEAANFDRMVGFSIIPGSTSRGVVLTQDGVIWRVSLNDATEPAVFGDLRDRMIRDLGYEEGLLGLAFSPGFQTDNRVYVLYTAGNPRRNVLSRFRVSNGTMDMASERVILEIPQPFPRHNGGQLAFGLDGYLYAGIGDGGSGGDPQGNGQNLSTLLGSILRIDVSGDRYTVPPNNPFVGREGVRTEIYAYGLRNPWRFSFDRATGVLWAADVGQDRWEEIDHIVPGGNYGWNIAEGFECFQRSTCNTNGLQAPRAVYGHDAGCSVTGGYVYRGRSMPELTGWYVYGDFCSGNIWAVNTAGGGPPVLLAETGLPIASFAELADGELLAITFANAIFRLERVQ